MLTDLPNVLTLARIAVLPVLVGLVATRAPWADVAACAVFVCASITDLLDGMIARRRGQTSDLGRMLDPIADKLLVGTSLMMLAAAGRLGPAGLYAALLILLREILVSGLREYLAGRVTLPATRLAKIKTSVQMVALGVLLLGDTGGGTVGLGGTPVTAIGSGLLWIAAALTVLTGWDYLNAGLRAVVPAAVAGAGRPRPGQTTGAPDRGHAG